MYRKGARKERDLIEKLKKLGFEAVRVAGSGAPDIVAGKKGRFYVIECKYSSKGYVYVNWEELRREMKVAERMGATFLLAVKFPNREWRFLGRKMLESYRKGKGVKVSVEDVEGLPSVEILLDKNLNEYLEA